MTTSQPLLRSIEGDLLTLCLKLGHKQANHIQGDGDARRMKLLKMAIEELQKLDRNSDAALSLDSSNLTDQDRATNALSHRMGIYCPRELR